MTEITFKGSRDMNTARIDQLRGQPTETGDAGRHIRERGFDKQYYLDLIIALVREHGPVSRKEIDQVLIPTVARPTDGRAEVVKGPQSHTGIALLQSDCQPRHPRSTRLGTHRRAPKE